MMQQVLHEAECRRKVLVQTVEADPGGSWSLGRPLQLQAMLVESLLDGRDALLVGTDIAEIMSSIAVAEVILVAQLIAEGEVEEVVLCVLFVEQRQLFAGLGDGEVFLKSRN